MFLFELIIVTFAVGVICSPLEPGSKISQQFSPALLPSYEIGMTQQYQRIIISGNPTSEVSYNIISQLVTKYYNKLHILFFHSKSSQ
jgi:hypothetical protein